ncbi:hypothetical protein RJ639_028998 [Escallonia herrerae]|uniref:Pentatricopeptide repeat-containing protein n=1 Tax=Escallonia herrerae TaxID=1293975 RepID=A0AA88X657_9ASTE|nr:hypothetical protein RJ639_028998 [Escallonia herrerae]
MVMEGVAPDNFTFPVLSACAKGVAYVDGIQIHGLIVKMGLGEDVFIENSLIHFYCECGEVGKGRKVFDEMPDRNIVSWTSLICGYGRRDLPKEAVGLFFEMVEAGIRPNPVTMVWLKVNTVLANALVDMYMKCGANDSAKRLFDECVDRNLVLYNTILSNYVRQGLAREALSIMNEMRRQGPPPDRVILLSAISASAELGDLLFGKQCHGYVLRNGLEGSLLELWKCHTFDSHQIPLVLYSFTSRVLSSDVGNLLKAGDVAKSQMLKFGLQFYSSCILVVHACP